MKDKWWHQSRAYFWFWSVLGLLPCQRLNGFRKSCKQDSIAEPRKAFAQELSARQIEREIIQHNVQIAVIVQVGETGAVRDAVQIKTPVGGPVSKGEIALGCESSNFDPAWSVRS